MSSLRDIPELSRSPPSVGRPRQLLQSRESASEMAAPLAANVSPLRCVAVRFRPGEELVAGLAQAVTAHGLIAPFVMTCVGSATHVIMRLANATAETANEVVELNEKFEIVSLVGTLLAPPGRPHLHISIADKNGRVLGGHLMKLLVYTTAEVVIGECSGLKFSREFDEATGFPELCVKPR
eukprot:m.145786 g.145786  ORF g.145786 m.145786 type:complete len:181 (+) comp16791_c1_seq2:388-930(+)